MMQITITARPNEIADLVLAMQGQQGHENAEGFTDTADLIFDTEVKVQDIISESSDLGTIVGRPL